MSSSKITSPIPLHPNLSALNSYGNTFMPNFSGHYPFFHPSQLGALSAVMSGNNPYSYLGSGIHPSIFQVIANAGNLPNSSRLLPATSATDSPFSGALRNRNFNHNLFNSPQTLSALNAYAHLFPYNAMTASGYPAGTSNSSSVLDLNGRPLSPLSLASRMYRNSTSGKINNNIFSSHHVSGVSSTSSGTNSLFGNGLTNGMKSRFSPYCLPPRLDYNARPPLETFMTSEDLQQSAFCHQRKSSSSTSPLSSSSPLPSSRTRTGSISSDYLKHFNKQSITPPSVSSAVRELRNMDTIAKGFDKRVQFENKLKVNSV